MDLVPAGVRMTSAMIPENQPSSLRFDDQGYSWCSEPDGEQRLRRANDFVCDLSHVGFLRASGPDAVAFMHAQLTNDLLHLSRTESQLSGYCNPKGRLIDLFRLHHDNEDLVLQGFHQTVAASAERLKKFIMRAKLEIVVDPKLQSFGVVGETAAAMLESLVGDLPAQREGCRRRDDITVVCHSLSPRRHQVIGPESALAPIWQQLCASAPNIGSWAWASLEIEEGLAMIFPATMEQFIPQTLNLDVVNGLNFDKGCYPGQEIVARMRYLGILKSRMARGWVESESPPRPGDKVFGSEGEQSIGMVVNATPAARGHDLLTTARLENLEQKNLRLENSSGPAITLRELPYALEVPEQRQA